MVPLKYLSNLWRTLEMSLVNFEINLDLNSSEKCVIMTTVVANLGATSSITLRKLYVAAMTLSACDNAKLLQQIKAGYKRTINWNKYQTKPMLRAKKPIFKLLSWSNFSGSKYNFYFILWKWCTSKKLQPIFSSNCWKRRLQSKADSGLVKLVMVTNVFFNKKQQEIKIKRFTCVKQIKSSFFSNSWNQRFYS